jgi:hypothetical protein
MSAKTLRSIETKCLRERYVDELGNWGRTKGAVPPDSRQYRALAILTRLF